MQLASTIPETVIYDIFVSVVTVPNVRAGAPEDLLFVLGYGFRVWGFGVSGFRGLGVRGLGVWVQGWCLAFLI